MKKDLELVQTDKKTIEEIVDNAVKKTFDQRDETAKKSRHIEKMLKKDKIVKEAKGHEHDCPGCNSELTELDKGITTCKTCGTTSVAKGIKYLICDSCGGIVPESYLGTNKACPHCGGTSVHRGN